MDPQPIPRRTLLRQLAITAPLLTALALWAGRTALHTPPASDAKSASGQSNQPRQPHPRVRGRDLAALVAGQSGFNFNLYRALSTDNDTNVFYSPYSIALALAMTYAGARGETAAQMAATLGFTLPDERLHRAFNALDQMLTSRGEAAQGREGEGFRLKVANALWGQEGFGFLMTFLDTLAANYGAGLQLVDFADPEAARQTINQWVSQQTEERIAELLARGIVDATTRLVLTNAIYFNAAWLYPFRESATSEGPFTLLDGSEMTVPFMHETADFRYTAGDGYQAVELPYSGDELAMLIVLPARDTYRAFEQGLDGAQWAKIVAGLDGQEVGVTLPRFEFASELMLAETLAALGMPDAFGSAADFSGMTGQRDLSISTVVHQALVSVDEAGTEAAAATAVEMALSSSGPMASILFTADHPFLFVIRDRPTGAILFTGRVLNPPG